MKTKISPQIILGIGAGLVGLTWALTSRARTVTSSELTKSPITRVPIKQTAHLSNNFFQAVDGIAKDFSQRGANLIGEDILAVFLSESGVKPWIRNQYGYAGLNGMGESERKNLGFSGDINAWTALSADQQLPYVRRFFESNVQSFAHGNFKVLDGPGKLYLMNITPAYLDKPPNFVIFPKGSTVYARNRVIDTQGKGYVEVADMDKFVLWSVQHSPQLWNELRMRLNDVRSGNV
jgi:hypothetical protein